MVRKVVVVVVVVGVVGRLVVGNGGKVWILFAGGVGRRGRLRTRFGGSESISCVAVGVVVRVGVGRVLVGGGGGGGLADGVGRRRCC